MSIAGSRSMTTPFFHELKKQASFFLKEKIRTARLALTDVTPAELLTEEATNGSPWAPDPRTMRFISRAAFEIDDYWRIVEILHKRLEKFDRKQWREAYKALVLLEHLLTQGPESVAEEFQSDRDVIRQMGAFQYIDERGFNWGATVRKKSERALRLLEKGPLLREERDRARKVTRGIQGFGSFNIRWSGTEVEHASTIGRSNSHYEDFSSGQDDAATKDQKVEFKPETEVEARIIKASHVPAVEESKPLLGGEEKVEFKPKTEEEARIIEASHVPTVEESKPLLGGEEKDEQRIELRDEHPFNNLDHRMMGSKLLLNCV